MRKKFLNTQVDKMNELFCRRLRNQTNTYIHLKEYLYKRFQNNERAFWIFSISLLIVLIFSLNSCKVKSNSNKAIWARAHHSSRRNDVLKSILCKLLNCVFVTRQDRLPPLSIHLLESYEHSLVPWLILHIKNAIFISSPMN